MLLAVIAMQNVGRKETVEFGPSSAAQPSWTFS